jgi:hypothetical protein
MNYEVNCLLLHFITVNKINKIIYVNIITSIFLCFFAAVRQCASACGSV